MANKNHPIPQKVNFVLMLLLTALNLFAMFYLPLVLLPINFAWALVLIPIVLCTNTYWSLIHEGIHSIFNQNKTVNNFTSRVMVATFGSVFHIVQFGHLMHHAYSRTVVDRPEVYEKAKHNYFARSLGYYFKLIIGLYLIEVVGPLLAYCPQKIIYKVSDNLYAEQPQFDKIVKNRLLSTKSLWQIRLDATVMYALYIMSFICYGQYWWLWLVVILLRGFMLSFSDNLPHYGTPVEQVRYSYNLSMPRLLSRFILNFNLHRIHHEQPNVPWTGLAEIKNETQDTCDINYFKQGLRQFRGLINIERLKL